MTEEQAENKLADEIRKINPCLKGTNHEVFQTLWMLFDSQPALRIVTRALANVLDEKPKQLCPKCNGQGMLCKPAHVPGDVNEWTSANAVHTCNLCNGAMVI